VRAVIRASEPPVVVAAWSSGGERAPGRAWATIPFTVLLGRNDPLIPVEGAVKEATEVTEGVLHGAPDIRIIDCDHFIIFRKPGVVADLILEPL
jgi:pimeloyl-ACP methyl ester carboxylesterase